MGPSRAISVACVVVVASSVAVAQRRAPGLQGQTVAVAVALKAGGSAYQFAGPASCTYAPIASIYGVMAEQWRVEQSDGSRSLTLTLWKPKNGSAEMFSMSLSDAGATHSVNTIKAGGQAEVKGSGSVRFAPAGKGGIFTIDAKAGTGTAIAGTIKCDAFAAAIAEGGE